MLQYKECTSNFLGFFIAMGSSLLSNEIKTLEKDI